MLKGVQKITATGNQGLTVRGTPKQLSKQGSSPNEIVAGCKVKHPKWGIGTVVTKEGDGPEAQVKVAFPGLGIKSLVLAYANLEKVE